MSEISPIQYRRVEARAIINLESSNTPCRRSFKIPVNVKLSHGAGIETGLARGAMLANDRQRNVNGTVTC